MRSSDLCLLVVCIAAPSLPLRSQPVGGGIFGSIASVVSDKVNGASNLTTPGAVPFVSSAGTLGQDSSNFSWDSTAKMLTVGNGTGYAKIGQVSNLGGIWLKQTTPSLSNYNMLASGAAPDLLFNVATGGMHLFRVNNGGDYLTIKSTGVGIGPSNTAPTGTLSVVNRTAVTGATSGLIGTDGTNTSATTTQLVVRAGAAQSTTNLQSWQDNAGNVLSAIAPGGGLILSNSAAPTLANSQFTVHAASNTSLVFTMRGSDGVARTASLTLAP